MQTLIVRGDIETKSVALIEVFEKNVVILYRDDRGSETAVNAEVSRLAEGRMIVDKSL